MSKARCLPRYAPHARRLAKARRWSLRLCAAQLCPTHPSRTRQSSSGKEDGHADGSPKVQTLHTLSEADAASPLGEELAACFPTAELLWHDGGSAMPGRSWWRTSHAFIDRATGVKRYVDQHKIGKLFAS